MAGSWAVVSGNLPPPSRLLGALYQLIKGGRAQRFPSPLRLSLHLVINVDASNPLLFSLRVRNSGMAQMQLTPWTHSSAALQRITARNGSAHLRSPHPSPSSYTERLTNNVPLHQVETIQMVDRLLRVVRALEHDVRRALGLEV